MSRIKLLSACIVAVFFLAAPYCLAGGDNGGAGGGTGGTSVPGGTMAMCFLPSAPINLVDGGYKRIEDIEVGDSVLVYDEEEGDIGKAMVREVNTVWHDNVHELHLANGKVLEPTANHPFLVKDKGWATISGLDELGMGVSYYL